MEFAEKRKFIRFPFYYHIKHRRHGETVWSYSYTDNVSLGGIVFLTASCYEKGQAIEMEIQSPQLERIPFGFTSKVVWKKKFEERYFIGARFESLSAEQLDFLRKIFSKYFTLKIEKDRELDGTGKKVLIIEDDLSLLDMLSVRLQEFHYEVFKASSGSEGLELCIKNRPHVIILDVNLPDILGLEITETIKCSGGEYGNPGIIVITGLAYTIDDAKDRWIKETGVSDFISKPFDIDELLIKIKNCIK